MDLKTYLPLALRTAKIFPSYQENLRHAALGLITEIGEYATEVKRITIYGKPQTPEMTAHMREELGDVMWYCVLVIATLGYEGRVDDYSAKTDAIDDAIVLKMGFAGSPLLLSLFASSGAALPLIDPNFMHDSDHIVSMTLTIFAFIDKYLAPMLGTTGDQLRADNIAKLRLRYPDKYSDEAAEARADKGGLDANHS